MLWGMTPWAPGGRSPVGWGLLLCLLLAAPVFGLVGCLVAVFDKNASTVTLVAVILDACIFMFGLVCSLWFLYQP